MSIDYQLIKSSKRKTLGLQVRAGKVFVRAPHALAQSVIDAFIIEKQMWLKAKIEQQVNYLSTTETLTYLPESFCLYQGERKQIQIVFVRQSFIEITDDTLIVGLHKRYSLHQDSQDRLQGLIKKQIEHHLKVQATSDLIPRIEHWQNVLDLAVEELIIKRFKARWGSCTSKGVISLNYLLMMCPVYVRDYVVIHELCHLVHLNHSADFWRLVSEYCPQYNVAKKWFADNHALLSL